MNYKKKMTNVFEEDETSPHLHIIGVPIIYKNKYGMSKQVGKSDVFTKESLAKIQDKIRVLRMESFNKEYNTNYKLKPKLKGRNRDYHITEMENYQKIKKSIEVHQNNLNKTKDKTDNLKDNLKSKNEENSLLKSSLDHLKNLIYNLVQLFMDRIFRNKDKEKYIEFAKDLYVHGALD